jgi:hypothetical protein
MNPIRVPHQVSRGRRRCDYVRSGWRHRREKDSSTTNIELRLLRGIRAAIRQKELHRLDVLSAYSRPHHKYK